MAKQTEIEIFYDYIDHVAMKLYDINKTGYLEGINEALTYLLDDSFKQDVEEEKLAFFKSEKAMVTNHTFDSETIRKAIQLALLKGFKHARITNAQMTPDTIGMFMSYLIKKLYKDDAPKRLFDPMIGTGNLMVTLYNHLEEPFVMHGVDDDPLMCELARNIADALDVEHQVFLQDTLTFEGGLYDLIVTDFPPSRVDENRGYLPYYALIHHLDHLKDGGFFLALIENDFFEQTQSELFKELVQEKAHMYGLIKLDESLFKVHPKSLLLLKKKTDKNETIDDFLLVDLPSFTDVEAFNKALTKMDQWFKKKEVM